MSKRMSTPEGGSSFRQENLLPATEMSRQELKREPEAARYLLKKYWLEPRLHRVRKGYR